MSLSLLVDSLDGVPETLRGEYKQTEDGKFRLDVDGIENVDGLKSALQKERDEKKTLKEKYKVYEGIDPAKAQEALSKLQKLEEKELLDSGEVEKVIEKRTALMRSDHEAQVKKILESLDSTTAERDRYKNGLNKSVIERGILDAANQVAAPKKEALEDIIFRGSKVWQLDENGEPQPTNPDGTLIYGKDGRTAMTMAEWAQNLVETAPHLFQESRGGGARGSVGSNGKTLPAEVFEKMNPTQKANFARGLS